jgi:glycosyltransferase involved in cell wall biosynthesis
MANNPIAKRWIERYNVGASVRLLGRVSRDQMAELFRLAWINVSISEHDGLPNTLLESLACGAFPVVGDIESLREWIEDGVNGFLVPPDNPDAVAAAILRAIDDTELRRSAAAKNHRMIEARADHSKVMPLAEKFYADVIAYRKEAESRLSAGARS